MHALRGEERRGSVGHDDASRRSILPCKNCADEHGTFGWSCNLQFVQRTSLKPEVRGRPFMGLDSIAANLPDQRRARQADLIQSVHSANQKGMPGPQPHQSASHGIKQIRVANAKQLKSSTCWICQGSQAVKQGSYLESPPNLSDMAKPRVEMRSKTEG